MNPQVHLIAGLFCAALIGFFHSKETRLSNRNLIIIGIMSGLSLDFDIIPGIILSIINHNKIVVDEIAVFHTIYTHNLLFMIPAIIYFLYSYIRYNEKSKRMQIMQIISIGILTHLLLDWVAMWIMPFGPWSDMRWGLTLPIFPPEAPTLHFYFELNGWGFYFYRFVPIYEWIVVAGFGFGIFILVIWRYKHPIF